MLISQSSKPFCGAVLPGVHLSRTAQSLPRRQVSIFGASDPDGLGRSAGKGSAGRYEPFQLFQVCCSTVGGRMPDARYTRCPMHDSPHTRQAIPAIFLGSYPAAGDIFGSRQLNKGKRLSDDWSRCWQGQS